MKSYLTRFVDYHDVEIPAELLNSLASDGSALLEDRLQREETALLKRHMTIANGDEVRDGSIVTVSIKSAIPKFNRNRMPITVGLGMYSSAVESALVGKKVGEMFALEIDGENVSGEVLDIKERRAAESISEIVFSKEHDGVESYDDWRAMQTEIFYAEYSFQQIYKVFMHISHELMRLTEPVLDQGDCDAMYDRMVRQYEKSADRAHLSQLTESQKAETREAAKLSVCLILYSKELFNSEAPPEGADEVEFYANRLNSELMGYAQKIINKKENK